MRCLNLIYDVRSPFKIYAHDWLKSITCVWLPGNNQSFVCVTVNKTNYIYSTMDKVNKKVL